MNVWVADEELLQRLRGIVEPQEIRDANGKVIGIYTPVLTPEEQAAYARAAELFDLEELDRIEREEHGQGRPLTELWKRLGVTENAP
jgi:hypothetical protein